MMRAWHRSFGVTGRGLLSKSINSNSEHNSEVKKTTITVVFSIKPLQLYQGDNDQLMAYLFSLLWYY